MSLTTQELIGVLQPMPTHIVKQREDFFAVLDNIGERKLLFQEFYSYPGYPVHHLYLRADDCSCLVATSSHGCKSYGIARDFLAERLGKPISISR